MAKLIPVSFGDRFGRLVYMTGQLHERGNAGRAMKCTLICDCGTVVEVWKHNLTSGHTTSCGCAKVEAGRSKRTHGQAYSDLGKPTLTYKSWLSMRDRTSGTRKIPGYVGVTCCDRWSSFENFLADMGERVKGTTLDRIDPTGNYEPSNCRWATLSVQSRNRMPYVHPSGHTIVPNRKSTMI